VPQLVNMVAGGLTPLVGRAALAEMGFAFVLYANAALQAAIHGMGKVLRSLKENGSLEEVMDQIASFEERQRAVAKPLFDALEQKYATDSDHGKD